MRTDVAILGSTGIVGQKVIALLLEEKNIFNIKELSASELNVNKKYKDSTIWKESLIKNIPAVIQNKKIIHAENIKSNLIISCLPHKNAELIEKKILSQKNKLIFSNASTYRMDNNVPLLIPEINSDSLSLLRLQKTNGKIITNSNCATAGIALTLAPLMQHAIEHINIVTLQSISGAGYPGISSLDMLCNTIPNIDNEVNKILAETRKILPILQNTTLTASVHRVPVIYGHTVTLHIIFKENIHVKQIAEHYKNWNKKYKNLFILYDDINYPQVNKCLSHDDMSVHIGKIQQGEKNNIIKINSLTHNLVRGAAGACISNMKCYLNFISKK